jgi:Xaa-Pro aminopeptidase
MSDLNPSATMQAATTKKESKLSSESLVPCASNDDSSYRPAFPAEEYEDRISRLRAVMAREQLDAVILAAPANLCYFTGLTGSSFYVPQYLLVTKGGRDGPPKTKLMMRAMDAPAARCTTHLAPDDCLQYSESYIDHPDRTPVELFQQLICSDSPAPDASFRVGAELGKNGLSGQELLELQSWSSKNLGTFTISDVSLHIRRLRLIKSELELQKIRQAARVVDEKMKVIVSNLVKGKSTAFASGEGCGVQRRMGGCAGAMDPMLKANEQGAHMMCNAANLSENDYVSIEIGGAVDHYHCPLSRSKILMSHENLSKNEDLRKSMEAVCYAMGKTLKSVRPGVSAHDVYWTFENAFNEWGYSKKSRIGYSFGIGFPPGWGDEIMSVYDGDMTMIQKDMVLHLIIGCGSNGDGSYAAALSEPIVVTEDGVELLSNCPREIFSNDSFNAAAENSLYVEPAYVAELQQQQQQKLSANVSSTVDALADELLGA